MWFESSAVAESPQVPTGSHRGCGAMEVIRQWERAQDKETKESQAYSQPSPQDSTLHVPFSPHMAFSLRLLFLASSYAPLPHIPYVTTMLQPHLLSTQLHCVVEHSPDDPLGTGGCGQRPLISEVAAEVRGQQCRYIQSGDPGL